MFEVTDGYSRVWKCNTPREIYELIVEEIYGYDSRNPSCGAHMDAASAEGWCEVACVGEIYEHENFQIEVV